MADTSTTTQGWKQKYTGNRPLRKAKEQVYAGISVRWFYIVGFWCVISILLTIPLIAYRHWIFTCFIVSVEIAWWSVYLLYFRSCEKYDESMLTLKFFVAEMLGKHEVCKFDMDENMLNTYISVKSIYDSGLIQYTRGRFGVLIKYTPPTDPGDQMESHLIDVQGIINRLSGDMQVAFISSSRFGTQSPLLKKFERMINEPGVPKKNVRLIKSQYDKIKSGKPSPDWAFYISLGLGSHATVEDAEERLTTEVPGFLDGLDAANISAELITDKTEIVKCFLQFMVPRDF